MATLGTLTLKLRATRKALALDLLQSKQEVEQWQQQMTPLLNLKAGVTIDWDSFSNAESEIRRWVDSLPKTDLRVGAKFVGADLAQNIQELERLLANPLKILVDDTRLFELNEHFKLKERDYKQLQAVLSSPLEIKVDRSQLDNLSRDLRSIENTPQVNLRANINIESLRSFHEQLNRYSQGRTLELATSVSRTTLNALQNDLKSLASNLTTARVSVQIDSQLQALRSELGNLPNVSVGVSIDDSALGEFDRKLGKRQIGIDINPGDIGNIEGHIDKLGKKLDGLKPASGLFKAVTFAPAQIATGFFQGVGKNLSNGLGKGYSQGIEAALGDTIGSTELLGRKLAELIANRGKSAIAQLVPTAISDAIKQSINQALGEAEVFVESRSKQATISKGQRKKKDQSREGVAEERREATRDLEDRGFEVSFLKNQSDKLERSYQAQSRVKNIIDEKIETRAPGSRSRAKLESTSAQLDFSLASINEEQVKVGKQLGNRRNALEQSERRVIRADTVYNTLKPTQLPKVYRDAIGDVAEDLIPEIRVDRGLAAKGADATYSAKSNRIKVSPELYKGIQSGNLTQEQFKVMYHELQHGKDFKFGQFDGLVDRDNLEVRKPLKATAQEVKDVAPFLSQYKPELREVEQNAEIAGRRASTKVYDQQQRQVLSTQLTNAYGLGGIKLDKAVNSQAVEAAKRTISINQLGEQSGLSSPSAAKIVDRAITLKDRQKQIGLDIAKASNGELNTSQIEELQSRINKQVEGVEHLSKRIDALKKSILKRVEQSKQVIPQPVETNIADPWAKSEGIVIDREKVVEVAARAGQALNQTVNTGKSIVSGVKNTASNIATGAKSNYGLLQYGEAMLMNASPQARLIKSQIQTNIGDRIDDARYQIGTTVNASGQFAGSVYRGLKAAESVPLGLLPGGYTAKKLIQNVAVPTALYSAAHAVPGLNMMLDAASGGIHALAGGAGNLLSSGATSGMANFVSQALGSVPFSESVVPAVQQGLGAALNATITGGAEAAATFGAPVLIGKSIANVGTKSIGTGLQKLAQSNPLLPPAQTPLRLKAKAEPEYEYVEVQAKAVEASANKNPTTSNLPLNLPERKKEPKSVELAPPKLITQITESDGLARGKTLAKQFQNASKQIKEALKKGELELAFAMSQQIESFAKGATTEIANITSLLGDKAAFGTTLGSQLANTKSQITKARNTGIRAATVYQNSNPPTINDDELASLRLPKPGEIRDGIAAKLAEFRNLFTAKEEPSSASTPPQPLGRPLPPPNRKPPASNRPLGRPLPPPDQIIPELAAKSFNPGDLIASIEQKLNYFDNIYPQAENQVRGSEKRGSKNTKKFLRGVDRNQDLFDSSFSRIDRESSQNLDEQIAKTQNLTDRVFTENGIVPLGRDVDRILPKLSDLRDMGLKVLGVFGGFTLLSLGVPALLGLGKSVLDTTSNFEQLQLRLQASTGSIEKGKSLFSSVRNQAQTLGVSQQSSLETAARISATTYGTELEGLPSETFTSQITQLAQSRGLSRESTNSLSLAVSQILGKPRVSAEELNQLVESGGLPDARTIGARALGYTPQQFSKTLESGAGIDPRKFVSSFLTQANTDSLLIKDAATDTQQAKISRLQGKTENLQLVVGNSINPAFKAGLDLVSTSIDLLIKGIEIASKVLIGFATVSLVKASLAMIEFAQSGKLASLAAGSFNNFQAVLPTIKAVSIDLLKLGAQMAAFYLIAEGISRIADKWKNAGAEISAAAKEIQLATQKSSNGTISVGLPDKAEDIGGKDWFDQWAISMQRTLAPVFNTLNPNKDVKAIDNRVKEQQEREDASSQLYGSIEGIYPRSQTAINAGTKIKKIDLELSQIDAKRTNLFLNNPDDAQGIQTLSKQYNDLYQKRTKIFSEDISPSQGLVQTGLNKLKEEKDSIEKLANTPDVNGRSLISLDEYNKRIVANKEATEKLTAEQLRLNKAIKLPLDDLSRFRDIVNQAQADIAANQLATIQRTTQTYLAAAQDPRNTGGKAKADFGNTQISLTTDRQIQERELGKLKANIYQSDNLQFLKNFGLDPEKASQDKIELTKSTTNDTREQALLSSLSKYQQVKTELAQTNQSLFESQYSYIKSIADYNKQLTDKVISLDNKLINLQLSARNSIDSLQRGIEESMIEIDRISGKAMLQSQKNRMQTAYNKFLEKLGISTDDIFEQIFQNYNSILDTIGQMTERPLNDKQNAVTAKYREKTNANRKTQIQTEQNQSNSELRRQNSEEKLNNPLNNLPGSESPPATSGEKSNLISPVKGGISSGFGWRTHPVTGKRKYHEGADYPVPVGTSIKAAGDGVVTFAGNKSGYGYTIDLKHPSGETTRYAHASKIGVAVGQQIRQGEEIGLSGGAKGHPGSGTTTGAHLHFETRNSKGVAIDPVKRLKENTDIQSPLSNKSTSENASLSIAQENINTPTTGSAPPNPSPKSSSHSNRNDGGYTNVVSSFYTPGEGGAINGGKTDIRGKYIDRYSHVMATRTTASPQGIPYGAKVELRNPANGKTTTVYNTDRGTLRPGRDIDLTPAAAKNLGVVPDGLANLQMRVISVPKGQVKDSYDLGGGIGSYDRKGNYTGRSGTIVGTKKIPNTQPIAEPSAESKAFGQKIINNAVQTGVDQNITKIEKQSDEYVADTKRYSDIDTSLGKQKLAQEQKLSNQQDRGDSLKVDTQILQNRNFLNRSIPIFNRKTTQLERDASAYNRSADRTPYQQLDKLKQQYGGTPDTTTLDTSITESQTTFDRIKEESRARRENILKQIQSIEATSAGWATARRALLLDIKALRKRGENIKADKSQQVLEDNDRAFGTPQARQKTVDALKDQYNRLPSDGINSYDAIAPRTAKVLTDYQSLNQEYQPKTFNDNLQAQGRSIVERFKSIKDTIEAEYNLLGEAAIELETEIQAKLKAAGYAPQLIDVKDPERLKLLQKVAPEETKRLVSAVQSRDQVGATSKQLDIDAKAAAARTVTIAKQREQINVDRLNTDYLESTQGGDIFARIQIDKQKFNTGKAELDLEFPKLDASNIDLYNAKLNQLTLETNTLRNAMLPLREASNNFFQDIFKGKDILSGIGDAFRNLAIGILTNLQNIISKHLGEQLFGGLLKGAEGIQGSANGKKTGNMLLDQVAPAIAQGLGLRSAGAKSGSNNDIDISLNNSPLDEDQSYAEYDVPRIKPYSSPRGRIEIPQLAVNAYESYRKTQVDSNFIGPVYQPPQQTQQQNIGGQIGGMVLGTALKFLGIPGFADGGMVTSPTLALVGEGINNEAIVPLPNGRSIPVDLKGAGESSGSNSNISNAISVTIQNSGQAKETSRGDANAIASLVQNLVTQGLIAERRPGGLLA